MPAARQTDVFADGQVQIVEFDVPEGADAARRRPRRCARRRIPDDSQVVGIIRGDTLTLPRGDESIEPGDRIVVIGSPERRARVGPRCSRPASERVEDVVVFGGGQIGTAIARVLLDAGHPRAPDRAGRASGRARSRRSCPACRVYNATGRRPRLPRARADRPGAGRGVRDAATTPRTSTRRRSRKCTASGSRSRSCTTRSRREVYEHAGVDVADQPARGDRRGDRALRARPAHPPGRDARGRPLRDPRHHRPRRRASSSARRFGDMPMTRRADRRDRPRRHRRSSRTATTCSQAGDRVIVFTESPRVAGVEKVL